MALANVVCINRSCPESAFSPSAVVHLNHYIRIHGCASEGFKHGLAFCPKCQRYTYLVIQLSEHYRGAVVDDAAIYFAQNHRRRTYANFNNHLLPEPVPFPFTHSLGAERPRAAPLHLPTLQGVSGRPSLVSPSVEPPCPAVPAIPCAKKNGLQVRPLTDGESLKACTICLEIGPFENKVITVCGHVVHTECLKRWENTRDTHSYTQNYNQCPNCRFELFPR